jgi:DNA-binding SARP family transcriptional activator
MRAVAEFRLGSVSEAERTLIELHGLVEELGYDQFLVAEARLCPDLLGSEPANSIPGGYYPRLLERARSGVAAVPALAPLPEAQADFVVCALGLPTVTRPGDPAPDLPWRSERSKELFLFLLNANAPVSREDVQNALWPETPPSKLPSLFHSSLHRLRRAMGEVVVVHDRGGYHLNPALRIDYDVHAFEQHVADADHAGSDEERARSLESAVALYRGAFARSLESPWAEAIRERLDDRYLGARLALARCELTAGRFPEAIAHAEAALQVDPLNEEAVRHLIAAHVGAGYPDLALRAYRRLQDLLERETGALPSGDTRRALERAVTEGHPRI